MAKLKQATFDNMVTAAEDFVDKQKGKWGEDEWLDLLALLKQAGMDLSEEMQAYLRQLLEAMRSVYQATGSTQQMTTALTTATKDSVEFVKVHKAIWGYGDWEDFAGHVKVSTKVISKETSSYLSDILDSLKALYSKQPSPKTRAKNAAPAATPVAKPAAKPVAPKTSAAKPAAPMAAAAPAQPKPIATVKPATTTKAAAPKATAPKATAPIPDSPKPGAPKAAAAKAKPAAPKPTATTATAATAKPAAAPAKPKAAPSSAADDLTAISGIGPALQKKLQDHGVTQYAQIAALTAAQIDDLEANIIKFSGRIKRDGWVAQAKSLSAKK
jgi:predicted flap endonuclease-1-like 5' DNA nuclease